ncbi:hypothetical protein DICPUDRAFT_86733 [Dictyostelium purpureum]|uniref:Ribosomal protein L32 n=1 Tax=Dictyostelium purpureum TaxID=5786 RepID=F0ZDJ2_DICPU|nr:uncharacterized protein DICPUDRAFT_86733 [Dictyostelium purpureum]EGC38008.1 hypothetical protein DICPUDRAFT_86733 [Dictyostelium purpureum]|eukprot:XP_003285492.1 hypothetical protein DICPUDRAFT_86733 [Dictyostelium purpureum]
MQRSLLSQLLNNGRKFATPVTPFRQSNCIIPTQPFIQSQGQPQQPPQQQVEQPKMEIPTEENTEIELTARNSAKKYHNIHHYTICSKCATPKLKHNLCMVCLRKNSI